MAKGNFQISFGALSEPLHEQINNQIKAFQVTAEDMELEQRFADAITLCSVHSILTDSETDKARGRLMKRITKRLKEMLD